MNTTHVLSGFALGLCAVMSGCSGMNPNGDGPLGAEVGAGSTAGDGHAGAGTAAAGSGSGGTRNDSGSAGGSSSGGASSGGSGSGWGSGNAGSRSFGGEVNFADYPDAGFAYEPTHTAPETCAAVTGQATLRKKPMDIIFSIDNSLSMSGEISAVQARIDNDFAAIIGDSGIDYRVIMVSRYGNAITQSVCIGEPLGNACSGSLVNNRARFFHHNTTVGSNDMWCKLKSSFTASATSAAGGWQHWLRPAAFKVFVGITDDSPGGLLGCAPSTAQSFDTMLLGLSPQFGTVSHRNYAWYSIVGMAGNTTPLQPSAALQTSKCSGAASAGTAYQDLSKLTGGLRYSSCLNDNFDAMFRAIAAGVIERSAASCEYELPAPTGGTINPANIVATYHPGGASGPSDVTLQRVTLADQCASNNGFYLDDNQNPTELSLCEQACSLVQADVSARIDIDFGCLGS